jgi:hypothetical protein
MLRKKKNCLTVEWASVGERTLCYHRMCLIRKQNREQKSTTPSKCGLREYYTIEESHSTQDLSYALGQLKSLTARKTSPTHLVKQSSCPNTWITASNVWQQAPLGSREITMPRRTLIGTRLGPSMAKVAVWPGLIEHMDLTTRMKPPFLSTGSK